MPHRYRTLHSLGNSSNDLASQAEAMTLRDEQVMAEPGPASRATTVEPISKPHEVVVGFKL